MKSTHKNEMYMANAKNVYQHVGIFALDDAKVPNANGFASQWNIGFMVCFKNTNWSFRRSLISPSFVSDFYHRLFSRICFDCCSLVGVRLPY